MDALGKTFDSMSLFFGDARNNIHSKGRDDLGRLREQVEREGHGWLDGFLDTIESQASGSKTPYVNLLKTPSRTQTAKKTRATEALATARADKLMSVNKMAGSPVSKSTSNRMPLSPLGTRSLNTSMSVLGSSPAMGKKGKSVKVLLDSATSSPASRSASAPSKSSRSKGKDKKVPEKPKPIEEAVEEDEAEDVDMEIEEHSASKASKGAAQGSTQEKELPVSKKRKSVSPAASPRKQHIASSASLANREASPATEADGHSSRPKSPMLADATAPAAQSPDIGPAAVHANAEADAAASTSETADPSATAQQPDAAAHHTSAQTVITTSPTEPFISALAATPISTTATEQVATGISTATSAETAAAGPAPLVDDVPAPSAPAPAQPVRQVRSSWLSKALGGNTVPVNSNGPNQQQQRGSEASSSRLSTAQPRQTLYDLASLRKSFSQSANLLKRKSDVAGLNEESEAADLKADKVARSNREKERDDLPASFAQPIRHSQTDKADDMPASFANPLSMSTSSRKTDASAAHSKPSLDRQKSQDMFGRSTINATHAAPSATQATLVDKESDSSRRGDRGKSDIHQLSRKVDEMLASQAAKQKEKERAALSTSSGASASAPNKAKQQTVPSNTNKLDPPVDSATATTTTAAVPAVPTGFLRGLSNTLGFSLGLGGLSRDAEDCAKRLEAELKASREKEAEEKERALQQAREEEGRKRVVTTPVKAVTGADVGEDVEMESAVEAKSPEQVEEEDEAEVFAAVEPESPIRASGQALPRTSDPKRDAELTVKSTTAMSTTTPNIAPVPNGANANGLSTGMHSPNRPRASPPRTEPTGIPLFSPVRPRPQQLPSTTPFGSPGKTAVGGAGNGGLSRFAAVPRPQSRAEIKQEDAQEDQEVGQGRMYPSPSRIPVVKSSLQERIKLFEPIIAAPSATTAANGKTEAHKPNQALAKKLDKAAEVEEAATASEASDSDGDDEDDDAEDDASDSTTDSETASEEEDDSMDADTEEEIAESPMRTAIPAAAPARTISKPSAGSAAAGQSGPKTIIVKAPQPSRPPTAASMARSDSTFSLATSTATNGSRMGASVSASGTLNSARLHADKTLGIKPTVGPIKSLQPTKGQAASERRKLIDQERRAAQADRKADEERKLREAEARKKEYDIAQNERRKREIEARKQAAIKEKQEREARERVEAEKAAKAAMAQAQADQERKAEQERRRKIAAANAVQLAKSTTTASASASTSAQPLAAAKRVVSASSNQGAPPKMKEPVRLTKPAGPSASASAGAIAGTKMGPTSFRTAPTAAEQIGQPAHSTNGGMISGQPGNQRPPALQNPVRPSALSHAPQPNGHNAQVGPAALTAHNVLANQRLVLNAQLEAHAAAVASEDIVLPDIASEYSDSDDSDQGSPAFKRPSWAESPVLKELLRQQAARDPDELFGPVQPLNMEELFKAPKNKFRQRTSSANWSRDGLTKSEEEEYARRMGFASTAAQGVQGQQQGATGQRGSVHGPSGLGR